MSYKINLYKGEPVLLNDNDGQELGKAWIGGAEKIVLKGSIIAGRNIAGIEKINDPPELMKLEAPKYTSDKQRTCTILDKMRAELTKKFGWKTGRNPKTEKFQELYLKFREENKREPNQEERNKIKESLGMSE